MTRAGGALQVSGLRAGYGRRPVIDDLSLAPIAPGQIAALVGPNGAGKSTLLRAIAGLLPAQGSIRLGDEDLTAAPARRRASRVTFMPQILPQGVRLTVFEAVLSALRASPLEDLAFASSRDLQERAMATLERVGIAHLAMSGLDHLSGGERQLASLAQAVVREPAVLLLDEPTSALDLRHQVVVMALVRTLAADGRIVIAVLHDLALAGRWSDHLVVLDRGRVHVEGPPAMALTPAMLAAVYGVDGRITTEGTAVSSVIVDGVVAR